MLEEIKGVGPKTIQELNKLNIYSIEELVTYYPYRYNYYKPKNINEINNDEAVIINGIIENSPKVFYIKRNLNKMNFNLNTGNEIININIFNRAFLKNNLKIGQLISVYGKYNKSKNILTASDIKLKPILKEEVEPVYHLTGNLKKANFNNIMTKALAENYHIKNYIPEYLIKKYKFIDKSLAVQNIHYPQSTELLKLSKLLLIYEELFIFMLKINYLKYQKTLIVNNEVKKIDQTLIEEFINKLPFKLTRDQINAVKDITTDFKSSKKMNRLLLGDVGTGKTIIAFIALYINKLSGFQGVLMAPTEILAIQHFENSLNIFSKYNISIALLTSSTKKKERDKIIEDLKNKKIDILIGTHSVLNEEIKLKKLGLVITDEQHRFGVKQRNNLQKKGQEVDVLYMSATPIPRTLALTIYGDMDITQIKDKPKNNQIITIKLLKETQIKEVLTQIVEQIKLGHQIYVIVPMVEDNEDINMENVNSIYDKLNNAFNNKIPLDIIHGKLNSKEKDNIMKNFYENKTKILISTTVIEVGIDVSNATMIVIFNAERFGLATLHQLRGRVGRNNLNSYCYLISNYDKERLKIMEETNDGFEISEKDFKLRGTGDLFGIKQSGDMNFKVANLKTDYKILLQCKNDSEIFLKEYLKSPSNFPHQKSIIDSIMDID